MTAATCGCAVTVANGQVSVPGVKTPPVNVPQLQKNLPQVPSAPQLPSTPKVPQVSLPKTPQVSLPKVPAVHVPSTGGVVPKVPSVRLPSGTTGGGSRGAGGGGSAGGGNSSGSGAGAVGSGGGSSAQGGAAGTTAAARAAAIGGTAQGRALASRQRTARHERSLRRAARQLEGCLSSLSSFDRQVIVLRGGLHGRHPLSRAGTAQRLNATTGRVRSAEHSGLAGLRKANAQTGCGLFSGSGRNVAARRLAEGSVPALSPLAVAGPSPALVAKDSLPTDRGDVKGAQASSHAKITKTPSRAGLLPTSGGDGSDLSAVLWAGILAALAIGGAALLLVVRRRAADPYGYSNRSEAVYPYAWETHDWDWGPSEENQGARPQVEQASAVAIEAPPAEPLAAEESPALAEPAEEPSGVVQQADAPARRRRDRAAQAFGGLAASGAAVSLLLGRFVGRRRRR